MCRRVIQTYQQTFNNDQANVNRQNFKFQRIYKTKPEQYFRLKLTTLKATNCALFTSGVGDITPDNSVGAVAGKLLTTNNGLTTYNYNTQMLEVFLTGIPELTGRCNCQTVTDNMIQSQTNDFYLGNLYDTGMSQCPEMLLRDIPLDTFTIYINTHPDGIFPPFVGKFIVSFIIELLED